MSDPTYIVDYYAVLEISPGANANEIQAAYHKQQKEWHPDKYSILARQMHEKATQRSAVINEAYRILGDSESRKTYDLKLTDWKGPISKDGTPIITLGQYEGFGNLFSEVNNEEQAQLDKTIRQMSGYSPETLSFMETAIKADPDNLSLRQAYSSALAQKSLYLRVKEGLFREHIGMGLEEDISDGYLELTQGRVQKWREEKMEEARKIRFSLEVGSRLALPGGEDIPREDLINLTSEKLQAFEEDISVLARQRADVAKKQLEHLPLTYWPEGQVRLPKVAAGIVADNKIRWFGFYLEGDSVKEDSSIPVNQLPETFEKESLLQSVIPFQSLIGKEGFSIFTINYVEGLDLRSTLEYALEQHFETLLDEPINSLETEISREENNG